MTLPHYLRRISQTALTGLLLAAATVMAAGQPVSMHKAGQAGRPAVNTPRQGQGQKPKQDHLPQWMARHSNLSPAEQQRALENEPGFRDLPPQTQQRLHDQLNQLNSMTPEQRRRTVEHTEAMEHLTPSQREQFRGAMQQYRGLPEDRRRLVARAFRDLREMPVPQRQAILNSDHFRSQFTDQERGTLSNLLAVEPYLPVEHPNDGPSYGKQ
jgi:Protein of unknown function (DUF3106)